MLFDFIRFILTIIVFIGLKIYETLKFVFWRPLVYMVRQWRSVLGLIGIIVLIGGFIFLLNWLEIYLGIPGQVIACGFVICVLVVLGIWILYDDKKDEIKYFFDSNWQKARKITGRIM